MSYRIMLIILALAHIAFCGNELINPGLEADADGKLSGWQSFNADNPLRIVQDVVQEGKTAVYGENTGGKRSFGIRQVIKYDKPSMAVGANAKTSCPPMTIAFIWTFSSKTAQPIGAQALGGRQEPMTGSMPSTVSGRRRTSRKSAFSFSCATRRTARRGSTILNCHGTIRASACAPSNCSRSRQSVRTP